MNRWGEEVKFSERLVKRPIARKSITLRVIAGLILVYFLRMIQVSLFFMGGNLVDGVFWSSAAGGSLFPIPRSQEWLQ